MHLYGIFDLMRVMRKWGHPQLAVCPRFPWQNQMCVPDLHVLQTHTHTHTQTVEALFAENVCSLNMNVIKQCVNESQTNS